MHIYISIYTAVTIAENPFFFFKIWAKSLLKGTILNNYDLRGNGGC